MASQPDILPIWQERVSLATGLVTLADAKEHLEFPDDDRDNYINALILAATDMLDGPDSMTGRCFTEQTWRLSFDQVLTERFAISVFPAKSILSAVAYDDDDNEVDLGASNFKLVRGKTGSEIVPQAGIVWPATLADRPDAVQLEIEAGAEEIPPSIKQACLLLLGHWFEHREGVAEKQTYDVPLSVTALVHRHLNWFVT